MNMPTSITINDIIGNQPYDIYISPNDDNYFYINNINYIDIPYTFLVPTSIQNFSNYCIRVQDADGCIITNCFSIT